MIENEKEREREKKKMRKTKQVNKTVSWHCHTESSEFGEQVVSLINYI